VGTWDAPFGHRWVAAAAAGSSVARMHTTTRSPSSDAARPPGATSWPYHGRAQRRLVLAAVLVLIGAVSPWVDHVGGTTLGVQGAGVWTMAAGGMGLAGALFRHRGVVLVHAAILAITPLTLGLWQAVHLWRIGCDFRVCAPSFGLVLTIAGGVVAAVAAWRIHRGPPPGGG
jgi:hypothetical protein